jgi:hypothetical protein
VVVGGEPIASCVLRYRRLGDRRWRGVPMPNTFRRTYTAAIPAAAIEEKALGVEWFVEARDRSKRVAYWPKGYPSVTWSASIGP